MTLLTWSLASFAAAYVLTFVGLGVFQRRLQYFPDRRLTDLAETGMSGGEELRITTADGETLVAWQGCSGHWTHFPEANSRRTSVRSDFRQGQLCASHFWPHFRCRSDKTFSLICGN